MRILSTSHLMLYVYNFTYVSTKIMVLTVYMHTHRDIGGVTYVSSSLISTPYIHRGKDPDNVHVHVLISGVVNPLKCSA